MKAAAYTFAVSLSLISGTAAHAKANPGKLSFGSSGVGASPHLSIELLKSMTGINIVHVPYKGAAPVLARFNAVLVKMLTAPDMQQRMSDQGIDVTPWTP